MSPNFDAAAAFSRTLTSTLGASTLALALALWLGNRAARHGGIYDDGLRRLVEFAGALPLVVAIPLLGRVWPMALTTALVLGVHHGLRLATVCRNEIQRLGSQPFVFGARCLGVPRSKTHRRHVLPFLLPVLATGMLLVLPTVLGVEAAMSYLDLDPTPSFGAYILRAPGPTGVVLLGLLGGGLVALHAAGERRIGRILHGQHAPAAAPLAKAGEPTKSSTDGTTEGHRTDVRKRDSAQ